ncbi:cell envelope integrity/translocation protein TolA [Bartonella tribocorum]|uniref:TolA protein n=1 Tax=Bartonella tribocorum (strain DSM 28219 / CCUG 45778 / CIP 105476 / IBS 506) TaxID=382640 RepID=A9IYJ8_BART1|nr:cell envelope integrity/translocation protein TolA [Bartonella tribocorum]CAK02376.1 TolA protein [Bartonella tribocorum CIP 105476]CDO49716.1 TolA protein [Bartonella tribocorum]
MNKGSYHSMKRGLALSLVVHVIFLGWGAVQFMNSVSLPQPLEAIPITLAPLMEEFSSQQGSVKAPIHAVPAVKPTTKPQEKEDARHIGEGQRDSLAPFQPKEKPQSVETTPPPISNPSETSKLTESVEAKTEDVPKVAPEMPLQALEDAPKVAPEMPLQALEDAPKVAPETPLQALEDAPKVAPETPLQALEDAPKVAPEMPLQALEDASKVAPEMPLQALEDAPKVAPEMPLQALEDAPKVAPEMPLQALEDALKVAPEMPLQALEDAPPKLSLKPAHKSEEMISPKELAPTVQKVPAEQTVPQAPKIALPEKPLLPQFKPKFDQEFPMKKEGALNQKMSKLNKKNQEKQTIEDILAMEENNLLNRARSQGGGAKRSHTPEALGARKNIHDTTKMAQTLVNIAGGCIQQKLKLVALGGDLKNRPVVRLRFYLDREGMVMGDPIIEPVSGLESQQAIMIRQVYAAVFSCQPYADLPRDQYGLWGQGFDFNVDPLQEIR